MEYKYIKLPVLDADQHNSVKNAENETEASERLQEIFGCKVSTFYSRYYFGGEVWNLKTSGQESAPFVETSGEHGGANTYGNPIADTPEPGIRYIEKPETQNEMTPEFVLKAIAAAAHANAAEALCKP